MGSSKWNIDNILTYTTDIKQHHIDALAGYTREAYNQEAIRIDFSEFDIPAAADLGTYGLDLSNANNMTAARQRTSWQRISYLARLNYNFANRYSESFAVSDIVRQWNYISHITAVNDGIQNYQLFNDARSDFYETTEWSNGYPAATGIGCDSGGVMVVVYAIKGFKGVGKPIDNPLQIPAHKYSGKVLASGKEVVRTTPKFERGRLLGNVVFVSGTAAIKGENSEFSDDARVQAKEAIDVVEHLVEPSNISKDCVNFRFDLLRVYVRRPQDMEVIQNIFKAHFRDIPTHFLIADICRPELLLELEGIGHILIVSL